MCLISDTTPNTVVKAMSAYDGTQSCIDNIVDILSNHPVSQNYYCGIIVYMTSHHNPTVSKIVGRAGMNAFAKNTGRCTSCLESNHRECECPNRDNDTYVCKASNDTLNGVILYTSPDSKTVVCPIYGRRGMDSYIRKTGRCAYCVEKGHVESECPCMRATHQTNPFERVKHNQKASRLVAGVFT